MNGGFMHDCKDVLDSLIESNKITQYERNTLEDLRFLMQCISDDLNKSGVCAIHASNLAALV